jgi:hypothetical protein
MIKSRELVKIAENKYSVNYVSVVEFNNGTYEIAVMEHRKDWGNSQNLEIDYSIFDDVFKAESLMEVYGIVTYIIKPAYFEELE